MATQKIYFRAFRPGGLDSVRGIDDHTFDGHTLKKTWTGGLNNLHEQK